MPETSVTVSMRQQRSRLMSQGIPPPTAAAQGHAVFGGQGCQLTVAGADDRLVGGDHVLTGAQSGGNVFIGGVDAAHHLHHRVDGGIGDDVVDIGGGDGRDLRDLAAHQYLGHLHIVALCDDIVGTLAHHAEA